MVSRDSQTDIARTDVWIRHDGVWASVSGAPSQIARMAVVPEIGIVVSHPAGVSAWDGTSWRLLASDSPDVIGACSGGFYAAFANRAWPVRTGPNVVRFFDGGTWTHIVETGHQRVAALAPSSEGLYVGTWSGEDALRLYRGPIGARSHR